MNSFLGSVSALLHCCGRVVVIQGKGKVKEGKTRERQTPIPHGIEGDEKEGMFNFHTFSVPGCLFIRALCSWLNHSSDRIYHRSCRPFFSFFRKQPLPRTLQELILRPPWRTWPNKLMIKNKNHVLLWTRTPPLEERGR